MDSTNIFNTKKYNNIKFFSLGKDAKVILIFIFFGIIIGTITYYTEIKNENSMLINSVSNIINLRLNGNFFNFIDFSIIKNLYFIIILVILGSTFCGAILIPIFLILKSVQMALISVYLYSQLGILHGILTNFTLFLPNFIIFSFFIIYISNNLIKSSIKIKYKIFDSITQDIKPIILENFLKVFKLTIVFIFVSFIECCIFFIIKSILF